MILPHVHMLVAKTAYAQGRKLVTQSFVDLIKSGITQIEEKEDLQVFANFLEAFIGFYKVYRPR
jgi:CRISPR-associated protein Csm2